MIISTPAYVTANVIIIKNIDNTIIDILFLAEHSTELKFGFNYNYIKK